MSPYGPEKALLIERALEGSRHFGVFEGQNMALHLDERHLHAERAHDIDELAADEG